MFDHHINRRGLESYNDSQPSMRENIVIKPQHDYVTFSIIYLINY